MTSTQIHYTTASPPLPGREGSELVAVAGGHGHPTYPCLSRNHNPTSCVPCVDFSSWLRGRVVAGDVDAVGEYLSRIREANPGVTGSREDFRRHCLNLARMILHAPLERHLRDGTYSTYLDLRVGLVLLAVHEGFSGFIMTGEAADFLAAIMLPYSLRLYDPGVLIEARNQFVLQMAQEMSYWASWPQLRGTLRSLETPDDPELRRLINVLAPLPLGARAHAVDALRHLSADSKVPRTLLSLSRYETRKRGLDVADSCRRILATGVVTPAKNLEGWLSAWTRRDLLRFLHSEGIGAKNSFSKERLAELALAECADLLRRRMADAGVVELAPEYALAVRSLRRYVYRARETWRVWLGFGMGWP
ncbi:MAG: hypothetical protein ACREL3_04520 [Gemmatimonadales bacterium]